MTTGNSSHPVGVLFDYNGVLADDEELHIEAFRRVLHQLGVVLTDDLYKRHCLGRTDSDGFVSLASVFPPQLGQRSVEALVGSKREQYLIQLAERDVLYPGVVEVLSELSERAKLGIVTSSTAAEVLLVLNRYGLRHFFDALVTADVIRIGKPDPEGYHLGLAVLGIASDRVVVIEDAVAGIEAARGAGLKCIAVRQTSPDGQLRRADLILDRIGDLSIEHVYGVLAVDSHAQDRHRTR